MGNSKVASPHSFSCRFPESSSKYDHTSPRSPHLVKSTHPKKEPSIKMLGIDLAVMDQASFTLANMLAAVQDFGVTCIRLLGYHGIISLALVLSTGLGLLCIAYRASLLQQDYQDKEPQDRSSEPLKYTPEARRITKASLVAENRIIRRVSGSGCRSEE